MRKALAGVILAGSTLLVAPAASAAPVLGPPQNGGTAVIAGDDNANPADGDDKDDLGKWGLGGLLGLAGLLGLVQGGRKVVARRNEDHTQHTGQRGTTRRDA